MKAFVLDCSATVPWVFASEATPASDAQAAADGLVMRLAERYGGTARLACRLVDGSFTLSPAQLTGSQPLPQELADLLQSVSAG